ncbi:MAG: hypothetical protein GY940_07505 [bacterium]|nr:hypothetical protein [bacterium]
MRVQQLKENFPIRVEWIYFPLHPDTPPEGMTLEALFQGRLTPPEIDASQQRFREAAGAEGLECNHRTMTYNSRLAQELAKWADGSTDGDKLHMALYHGYFAEGKNIGDMDVLLELTGKAGLPVEEARKVLEERQFKDAVDRDWRYSEKLQVTGVPSFVASKYMAVGAQPYDQLAKFLRHCGISMKEK